MKFEHKGITVLEVVLVVVLMIVLVVMMVVKVMDVILIKELWRFCFCFFRFKAFDTLLSFLFSFVYRWNISGTNFNIHLFFFFFCFAGNGFTYKKHMIRLLCKVCTKKRSIAFACFLGGYVSSLMNNNATVLLLVRQVWLKLWIIIEPLCFSSGCEHSVVICQKKSNL